MTIDTSSPRSRRALLSAAAGATAALIAETVVPHTPAEAANGDPLVLGSSTNTATATTRLFKSNAIPPFEVLFVETAEGIAIHGRSTSDTGVVGESTTGFGVSGGTTRGFGVGGAATSGTGVSGLSDTGIGVQGYAPKGVGVLAKSETGLALSVAGKAHFSRSGRTWIRAGHASLTITVAGTTASSRVFAILASNRASRYVRAAVPSTDKFTVYLNANAISDSVVAWFILD
jgi:hypothetical protein